MAIIVGDLHGDLEKAKAFLDYNPGVLHIALGDYLDSSIVSPQKQLECLQILLKSDAVLLLGNHEVHYLKESLVHFSGYNIDYAQTFQTILESNIRRFKVSYAVDGWLLTHAGFNEREIDKYWDDVGGKLVRVKRMRCKKADAIAKYLQNEFELFLINRFIIKDVPYTYRSIFCYNYLEDVAFISPKIGQIFGHVEHPKPKVQMNYIALDTTNLSDSCWLYDTEHCELVQLQL